MVEEKRMDFEKRETVFAGLIDEFIASKDMKSIMKTNIADMSDKDMATIIWNSSVPLHERKEGLYVLSLAIDDKELLEQILQRMEYIEKAEKLFFKNDNQHIYALRNSKNNPYADILGFFYSAEDAIEKGRNTGEIFNIEKYQIYQKEKKSIPNKVIYTNKVEETNNDDGLIADFTFNKHGEIIKFWIDELSLEEQEKVESNWQSRFEQAYVCFSNPFAEGDRVRDIESNRYGTVITTKESWDRVSQNCLEKGANWMDASVMVLFDDDKGGHDHVHITKLEKVQGNENDEQMKLLNKEIDEPITFIPDAPSSEETILDIPLISDYGKIPVGVMPDETYIYCSHYINVESARYVFLYAIREDEKGKAFAVKTSKENSRWESVGFTKEELIYIDNYLETVNEEIEFFLDYGWYYDDVDITKNNYQHDLKIHWDEYERYFICEVLDIPGLMFDAPTIEEVVREHKRSIDAYMTK